MSAYQYIKVPAGEKITVQSDGAVQVPDKPIVGFIEGDGIGPDIWRASQHVFESAVKHAYGAQRKIAWMEIFAGEKANALTNSFLPDETLAAIREFVVSIKGPLTTPIGKGFRSLNVTLRQELDLFACVRPVRHYAGVPSPVKAPELVNMTIFRENTEDVYAGLELKQGTPEADKLIAYLRQTFDWDIRPDSGIGVKPISITGS